MIFELNLPPGESQSEFLIYFNSGLREIQQTGTGTASFGPDGSFTAYSTSCVKINEDICTLSFSVYTQPSGILTHIKVELTEESNVDWEKFVTALVTTALSKALSKQKTQFFHRMQLSYFAANMDGEYWIANFRLAPAIPEDPFPHLVNAERIIYLDFHTNAVDGNQATVLANEFSNLQAARLSLLLNIAISKPEQTMRWVWPSPSADNPNPESMRLHTMFNITNPLPLRMPKKGEFCKLGKFNSSLSDRFRSAGDLIELPKETRRIFRLIQKNVQFGHAFDACARLYQLGLFISRFSTSASLAYRVASIEAICKSTGKIDSPSAFIRKYSIGTINEEFLKFLYGEIRSGHFHAGSVPLDNDKSIPFHPLFTADYLLQSDLTQQGFSITRQAIINWILDEINKMTD
jgi:hypothetical protein